MLVKGVIGVYYGANLLCPYSFLKSTHSEHEYLWKMVSKGTSYTMNDQGNAEEQSINGFNTIHDGFPRHGGS